MAPPLEFNGQEGFAIINNEIAKVTTYDLHECDPTTVEAHRKAMEERRIESEEWKRLRDEDYAVAKTKDCPKCGAAVGEDCINLTVWKWKQIKQAVVIAHAERVEAGYKV